jgi:hypothetical protein
LVITLERISPLESSSAQTKKLVRRNFDFKYGGDFGDCLSFLLC